MDSSRKEKSPSSRVQTHSSKTSFDGFFIQEIREICDPYFLIITRSLEDIELTRIRRRWHPVYGKTGAKLIYEKIFNTILIHEISVTCISYQNLLTNRSHRESLIRWTGFVPKREDFEAAESWLRISPKTIPKEIRK